MTADNDAVCKQPQGDTKKRKETKAKKNVFRLNVALREVFILCFQWHQDGIQLRKTPLQRWLIWKPTSGVFSVFCSPGVQLRGQDQRERSRQGLITSLAAGLLTLGRTHPAAVTLLSMGFKGLPNCHRQTR